MIIIRLSLILSVLGLTPVAWSAGADASSAPAVEEFTIDRYAPIWTAKPFIIAPETVIKADATAMRYAFTGYASIGGRDVVFLFDRQTVNNFSVAVGTDHDDVSLLSVDAASTPVRARLRVGSEAIELTRETIASTASENSPSPDANRPAQQVVSNNTAKSSDNPANTGNANHPRTGGPPTPVKIIRRPPIANQ